MRGFGWTRWIAIGVAALAAAVALVGQSGAPATAQQPTPFSPQPTPIQATPIPPTPIPATPAPRPPTAPTAPATAPQPGQPAAPPVQTGSVSARIAYPPNRQIVVIQPFLVIFEINGIRLDANFIDQPSAPGVGHWLLLVDGVEVAAGDSQQVFLSGISPGSHELTLQIRNNDRSPLTPPVTTQSEVCIEVCSPAAIQPFLPEVPGGLPRTGTGGLGRPG